MAGGIDWFRWHHGSVTDPKFALVARKAGASLPDVLAVWAYLLERASSAQDRGYFGDIDAEAWDCLFNFDDGCTRRIMDAMEARDLVADGRIVAWEKRQPKREREDLGATDRKRAQRYRDAASHAEDSNVTPCHATSRQKTPRGEERREEENSSSLRSEEQRAKRASTPAAPADVDPQVWADWLQLRKTKKAPVTDTVIKSARSEAVDAGMSFEAFLRVWCARGSQGLQAEWLKPHERAGPSRTPTAAEARAMQAVPSIAAPHLRQQPAAITIDVEAHDVTARRLG